MRIGKTRPRSIACLSTQGQGGLSMIYDAKLRLLSFIFQILKADVRLCLCSVRLCPANVLPTAEEMAVTLQRGKETTFDPIFTPYNICRQLGPGLVFRRSQ